MVDTDDLVPVWTGQLGEPTRFEWRSHQYAVSGRPVPWINRAPWWTTASMMGTVHTVTQRMWRVTAVNPVTGESIRADLGVEDGHWWRLTPLDS